MPRSTRRFGSNNNCSTLSLPSLPENDAYTPENFAWFQKGDDEKLTFATNEKSKRALVIGMLIIFTLVAFFIANNGNNSDSTSLYHQNLLKGTHNIPEESRKRPLLFDDGTLFTPQQQDRVESTKSLCAYFIHTSRRHTNIKRIQLHINSYNKEDYLGAKLIANAAQLPLLLSGNIPPKEKKFLQEDAFRVGQVPSEHGKEWNINRLCKACNEQLCRDKIFLLQRQQHGQGVIKNYARHFMFII
mmetsp:Transcript_1002/g.1254  ORF Transcript_1002/g.1254 Transcript_1002/m.1254 type:complete len:244 (+) Transcript_1002:82-813(+)